MMMVGLAAGVLSGCAGAGTERPPSSETTTERGTTVTVEPFGTLPSGETVEVFTLRNANGLEVRAMSYGAVILSITTPDRDGNMADITLGFDELEAYLADSPYFGAIVGRYGNRIAAGRFELDGTAYELARNNGPNHLHGGVRGFDKVLWEANAIADPESAAVAFRYTSIDGEEGYPGTLLVTVQYALNDANELAIAYVAATDAATPVNLTQHTYFNLSGVGGVLGHELQVNADRYTPVDAALIPTGESAPVAGTPFDFRTATPIGARIDADDEQLGFGGGYDHNFVLNAVLSPLVEGVTSPGEGRLGLLHAARVLEADSGRVLDVFTTEPGMQLYSGNLLDGTLTGKEGATYEHRSGFCLETQHFPDSPNQPTFPSTIVRPDAAYRSLTVWRFSTVQ